MDGIHSFEKRSKTRHDVDLAQNRLIVVDHNGSQSKSISKHGKKDDRLQALITGGSFPSNELRTSKYTLLSFLPRNLYEQFRRVANFYFLVTGLLQIVLPYSPVGPTTSLLPLFFVVSVTSVKQAYEDYLRHKLDEQVNNRLCHVLREKKLLQVRSKDIRVGDFVYVRNNEEIPCDMILLAASGSGDRCYVTTANLDGETSLKGRSCFNIKEQLGTIEQLCNNLLVIECERPNATLYEFNASLRAPKGKRSYDVLVNELKSMNGRRNRQTGGLRTPSVVAKIIRRLRRSRTKSDLKEDTEDPLSTVLEAEHYDIPLDISNLLLRASRLRNTGHVYGLAVYTGRDTKLALNSHVKPNKFSSTESKVNTFLLLAFMILILCSLVATSRYERPEYWYFSGIERADSLTAIFAAHFLLFNYLVPISLYVTLEFVKFFGTKSVTEDKKMRITVWQTISGGLSDEPEAKASVKQGDPINNMSRSHRRAQIVEKPKCNSSDLNEELGLVEVLFSDKTGTLTENKMRFMACSVQGQLLRAINEKLYRQPAHLFHAEIPNLVKQLSQVNTNRHAHLAPIRTRFSQKSLSSKSPRSPTQAKPFDHRVVPPMNELHLADRSESVVEFFVTLCLCSTITLNETQPLADCLPDKTLGEYDFQSASPDEESLITAAHQYGITMCKSNERECFIVIDRRGASNVLKPHQGKFKSLVETRQSTNGYIVRHFKRLLVFEFTSIRKRMSVIYQDCDNDCYLMVSKGSEELLDCIRLNKLDKHDENVVNITMSHFEAFAKSGLRTLLVARRVLQTSEYEKIVAEMKNARLAIQNRDQLLNKVYRESESELTLIGTTAVEDTLQDGVPETIANLRRAGIKVWLLTGDKVETAISVAYLCRLLEREMTLFQLVRQQDANSCTKLLEQFKRKMDSSVNNSVGSMQEDKFALVADGRSLHYAMRHTKDELANLCRRCTCVLGCRLSPLQKAEVVDMIKQSSERPITAAIGDGANDVSMIQEAHVGIGVAGKEGRQAVNSSDFAISRFHMLNRLLFVHGHLFYHRTANTIHYFFYKNVLFILPQFLFSFYNLSSAYSLYHPILLIGYNLFFTSLPILIYGLYEVPIPETILESFPELYRMNRRDRQLRISVFIKWLLLGALQAFLCFYALFFIWGSHTPFLESGKMVGINGFSIILYFCIIFTATFRLFFLAHSHSFRLCLAALASCIVLPLSFYGYSFLNCFDTRRKFLVEDITLYGQFRDYLFSPMFWLAILTALSVTLLPDIILYIPHRIEYFREVMTVIRNKVAHKTSSSMSGSKV